MMFLILQEIRFQDHMLKSLELSKKQAEKCKFIKTRQLHLSSLRKLFQPHVLNTCLTASICRGLKKQKFYSVFLKFVNVSLGLLFSQPQTYKMIVLRAVKEFTSCTSIEQSLFKQIVTRDKVLPQFIILVKKLLCMCTIGFCDQASS